MSSSYSSRVYQVNFTSTFNNNNNLLSSYKFCTKYRKRNNFKLEPTLINDWTRLSSFKFSSKFETCTVSECRVYSFFVGSRY